MEDADNGQRSIFDDAELILADILNACPGDVYEVISEEQHSNVIVEEENNDDALMDNDRADDIIMIESEEEADDVMRNASESINIGTDTEEESDSVDSVRGSNGINHQVQSVIFEEGTNSAKPNENMSFTFISDNKSKSVFKCYSCLQEFTDENDWQLHMKNYMHQLGCFPKRQLLPFDNIGKLLVLNEENVYQCKSCEYIAKRKQTLQIHYESKHCDISFRCALCPSRTFLCLNFLICHLHCIHKKKEGIYCCKWCTFRTNEKFNLIRHFYAVHSVGDKKCSFCSFKSPRTRLAEHMELKHKVHVGVWKCRICDFATESSGNLREHFTQKHPKEEKYITMKLNSRSSVSTLTSSGT